MNKHYYYCKECDAVIEHTDKIIVSLCEHTNKKVRVKSLEKDEAETLKLLKERMKP